MARGGWVVVPLVTLGWACSARGEGIVRTGIELLDDAGPADGETSDPVPWCDALAVLRAKCQRCHRDPPANGAPFPLLTYEDTQRPVGLKSIPAWQKMQIVVESGKMPATFLVLDPPVQGLTEDERQRLLGWLAEGAEPVGGVECP
jgi:hypothetical protein